MALPRVPGPKAMRIKTPASVPSRPRQPRSTPREDENTWTPAIYPPAKEEWIDEETGLVIISAAIIGGPVLSQPKKSRILNLSEGR